MMRAFNEHVAALPVRLSSWLVVLGELLVLVGVVTLLCVRFLGSRTLLVVAGLAVDGRAGRRLGRARGAPAAHPRRLALVQRTAATRHRGRGTRVGRPAAVPRQREREAQKAVLQRVVAAWRLTAGRRPWGEQQIATPRNPHQPLTVRFAARPVRLLHRDDPLWLVVARPGKATPRRRGRGEPWRLLTTEPVTTAAACRRIVKAYVLRWQVEQMLRFGKSERGVESVRVRAWAPRQENSEIYGLIGTAVILLLVFGSVVAMGLPIATALMGLGAGFALMGPLARVLDLPSFTPQFAAMIGLGVGIDYALLVVTRYRDNLHAGHGVAESVASAVGTAGRSVAFAGGAVAIAMLGMLANGIPFIGALGIVGAAVVLTAVLVAWTLLPALRLRLGSSDAGNNPASFHIGAAYGVLVAVFQWGWLAGIVGVTPGPIESFLPMMLFATVFGLSMDYEVFLISRIREEYLATGDNNASVARGMESTARVIMAGASIMVIVFLSFVLSDKRVIKEFGLGLAAAVVDATVVRLALVPAIMALLGDRNRWMPAWLDRLLPHVDVEGTSQAVPVGAHGAPVIAES